MSVDAFYSRTGESTFAPTAATVGPWDARLQHGGPIAALLTTMMEANTPRAGMRIAHFALEFLGPVPLAAMDVTTQIIRPGKKIELLGASVTVGGRPALRATAWRMATAPARNPSVNLDAAPPALPDVASLARFPGVESFGYGEALEWRFTRGGFAELGAATAWTRLRVAIVQGETPSAIAHAMAMVDSANGISAELPVDQYLFVPVNLTVSIARQPEGQWLGMSARTELAAEGAGTTSAQLFDRHGYFGQALQTLFVEPRPASGK